MVKNSNILSCFHIFNLVKLDEVSIERVNMFTIPFYHHIRENTLTSSMSDASTLVPKRRNVCVPCAGRFYVDHFSFIFKFIFRFGVFFLLLFVIEDKHTHPEKLIVLHLK